jgi:hypothetical protein
MKWGIEDSSRLRSILRKLERSSCLRPASSARLCGKTLRVINSPPSGDTRMLSLIAEVNPAALLDVA